MRLPAAARRLLVERRGDVVECRGEDRCDVAVRHLQLDATDLLVGYAIDEDCLLLRDLLDGVLDHAGRYRKEGERIEQARRRVPNIFADRVEERVRYRVRRERDLSFDVIQAKIRQ